MELRINKSHGLRNDVVIEIPRREIEDVHLHIANRKRLMDLPGLVRHREQSVSEINEVAACKVPMEVHLDSLGFFDINGHPNRRAIAIGCRNVGNNHGCVAWQATETPHLFHVRGEPFAYPSYSCILKRKRRGADLEARDVTFEGTCDGIAERGVDISKDVDWAVYANQVLRAGTPVDLAEIIDQFYDIQHVLAFDRKRQQGQEIAQRVYEGYPDTFRRNLIIAWREAGIPRNRYLHNCLGLSEDCVYILQREGTIEEMACRLREVGALDGYILDNGGSPGCWGWWAYPHGGLVFTAPDYRPNATAILAFVLKGPAATQLPNGSVSYSVV